MQLKKIEHLLDHRSNKCTAVACNSLWTKHFLCSFNINSLLCKQNFVLSAWLAQSYHSIHRYSLIGEFDLILFEQISIYLFIACIKCFRLGCSWNCLVGISDGYAIFNVNCIDTLWEILWIRKYFACTDSALSVLIVHFFSQSDAVGTVWLCCLSVLIVPSTFSFIMCVLFKVWWVKKGPW